MRSDHYTVIHPLDDVPEERRSVEGLGPIKLTRSVRVALLVLRGYLIFMGCLVVYRLVQFWGKLTLK